MNARHLSALPNFFDASFKYHPAPQPAATLNCNATLLMFKAFLTAFPHYHETLKRIFADGSLVGAFYELSGTFTGQVQGWPAPTGRRFKVQSAVRARFNAAHKQVESWGYVNSLSWFLQIGAILQ
jgi:predicted ester cyclase